MTRVFYFLFEHTKSILIVYLFIQILFITFSSTQLKSDSLYYYQLALASSINHSIYPSSLNINADYVIAPFFINVEALFLLFNKSLLTIRILNIFLNMTQLFVLFKITRKNYGDKAAKIFLLLYIFYLPNLGLVLLNLTELLFGVLFSLSILFILYDKKKYYLLSGLLIAISIAVRPTGWALLVGIIIFLIFSGKEFRVRKISLLLIGTVSFILVFGIITKINSGYFVFSSVNYGTNFLIGANDKATGAYNDTAFNKGGIGFIDKPEIKTYIEKQKFWFDQAVYWIAKNPIKWVSLIPMKFIHIFIWDDYAISPLLNIQQWNLQVLLKNLLFSPNERLLIYDIPFTLLLFYILIQILHHIYYFSIVSLLVIFIWKNFKSLIRQYVFKLFSSIVIVSFFLPAITFGDSRFKYPYILLFMIIISPFINNYFQNKIAKKYA